MGFDSLHALETRQAKACSTFYFSIFASSSTNFCWRSDWSCPPRRFRQLRHVHRAEFRAAHRAEFRVLVEIIRQRFVVHRLRRRGIERQLELLVPVKQETRVGKRIVAVPRARPVPRHVRRVRRDLVRDHALLHVLRVRQSQMLLRRHVAQHRRAVPADHRRSNRARDVVVARRDVNHQRPQRVKRRFVAQLHFLFHLQLDLIHRNVPRAFDHHLHVVLPRLLRQLAQHFQFRELRGVARIRKAARASTRRPAKNLRRAS